MLSRIQFAFSWLLPRLMYPFARLYHALNWQALRDIRHHKVVTSMSFWLFFVPLAAKVMHEVADIVHFKIAQQIITLHMTLPFSWQSLFFAALFFSAGSVLVSFTIPPIILENRDFAAFEQAGKSETHLRDYERKFDSLPEEERTRLMRLAGITKTEVGMHDMRDKFWMVYTIQNWERLHLRQLCSVCYLLGGLLLLDVLYKNILWVFSSLNMSEYLHQLLFWPVLAWLRNWL
jgi:hypothetical protein